MFWNECVDLCILQTHPQFIHAKITSNDSHPWLLTIVYGNPKCTLRKYLWQDLNQNVVNLEEPWVVEVDFNLVTNAEETTKPKNLDQRRSLGFISWISKHGLLDLGYMGPCLHGQGRTHLLLSKVHVLTLPSTT